MDIIGIFIGLLITGLLMILILPGSLKQVALLITLFCLVLLIGNKAVLSLNGHPYSQLLTGNPVTGPITLAVDALSAWFILIISFIFLMGGFYGMYYLKYYQEQRKNLTLHGISFLLLYTCLVSLCVVQNSLVFLIVWEIMTLSAFITIIFEHEKSSTIRAGINFLIQSHVSVLFLMIAFLWVAIKAGSYDFSAIGEYCAGKTPAVSLLLLLCFFAGFGIKAGFVPFHTWLPYAHPAAPAHISGIMSGVIIKIGIFGILRMLLIIKGDYLAFGYIILIISVISGLYGVMLAIVQHNLKKLLAYHSIENIGIIGIGIGIGCIGLGTRNPVLSFFGFAGALLHTLNHALFKSLLFFTAGNVYQITHTLHIEHLGGVIKKMPWTSSLFLIASIAICGIPPFNGFISEFLIYSGLYFWLQHANLVALVVIIFTIVALVLIGGLAIFCFTKAFGIIFLGTPRKEMPHEIKEVPVARLIPLILIACFIIGIGLFPGFFVRILAPAVVLFSGAPWEGVAIDPAFAGVLQKISLLAYGFLSLILLLLWVKSRVVRSGKVQISPTWGCGYEAPTPKMQYTAGSFVRTYYKLYKPLFSTSNKETRPQGIFPSEGHYESHIYDKIEKWFIDKPLMAYRSFMGRFLFLQNGKLQVYILYGILFIVIIICLPVLIEKISEFIGFLKHP
jgi:hydrogenase-4 component B